MLSLRVVFNLGEDWLAAKPPSGRDALHSECIFDVGENWFTAKPTSERDALTQSSF